MSGWERTTCSGNHAHTRTRDIRYAVMVCVCSATKCWWTEPLGEQ